LYAAVPDQTVRGVATLPPNDGLQESIYVKSSVIENEAVLFLTGQELDSSVVAATVRVDSGEILATCFTKSSPFPFHGDSLAGFYVTSHKDKKVGNRVS
jgi:hypothetical protein